MTQSDIRKLFRMPKPVKITGRTSSITNSFVNGIIPVIEPSEDEIIEALSILGMNENTICCAYCGDPYTEWDHLRPLVMNKTATGYVSEIHNLVPSCGKCNQSKGNQHWHTWMYSSATLSPLTRKIPDINERSQRLSNYENWGTPLKVDIESIIGKYKWQQHWDNCDKIKKLMHESQSLSDEIRLTLQNALNSNNHDIVKCFYSTASSKHEGTMTKISKKTTTYTENSAYTINTPIPLNSSKAVGKLVQNEFVNLLKSDKITQNILQNLEKSDYSKQIFNVNYPVLLRINSIAEAKNGVDHNGINRYYAKPITLQGNLYLLTSQWYERNKDKLIRWINHYS